MCALSQTTETKTCLKKKFPLTTRTWWSCKNHHAIFNFAWRNENQDFYVKPSTFKHF